MHSGGWNKAGQPDGFAARDHIFREQGNYQYPGRRFRWLSGFNLDATVTTTRFRQVVTPISSISGEARAICIFTSRRWPLPTYFLHARQQPCIIRGRAHRSFRQPPVSVGGMDECFLQKEIYARPEPRPEQLWHQPLELSLAEMQLPSHCTHTCSCTRCVCVCVR